MRALRGASEEGAIGSRPFFVPRFVARYERKPAMNTMTSVEIQRPTPPFVPSDLSLATPGITRKRVAVFGSFMGGYHVLRTLLADELARHVDVVGVATDDPAQAFTHPQVRLWKYPHTPDDELLVRRFAEGLGIPVYTGRVTAEPFYELFAQEWQPDLCLMATFGQKIPERLFRFPPLGFYNFHHSGETWPSYPGPDPIAQMQRDGQTHVVLTMHEVSEVLDGGRFVAHSHRVPLLPHANAITMHRVTWPQMGPFIRSQVTNIIQMSTVTVH
jgi:methionyl-tRNA formyltransferase